MELRLLEAPLPPRGQYLVKFLSPFLALRRRIRVGGTQIASKYLGVSYGATVFEGKRQPNDPAAPA
jgi:hypothetical protein